MTEVSGIIIRDWDEKQHFKDRDPIWIKIYRALRHDRRWRQLSGDGCKLYIDLTLLAAEVEPFGTIQLHPADLAWEVRLDHENLRIALLEVAAAGLITVVGYRDDIKLLSAGDQPDNEVLSLTRSREVEGEREKEKETTNGQRDLKTYLYLDTEELALFCRDFGISTEEKDLTLERLRV
jgi:hypothetical protein